MKYYTREDYVECGSNNEVIPVYIESDIGERYAEAMKKLAELENELELDRGGDDSEEEDRSCSICRHTDTPCDEFPCDDCLGKTDKPAWRAKDCGWCKHRAVVTTNDPCHTCLSKGGNPAWEPMRKETK